MANNTNNTYCDVCDSPYVDAHLMDCPIGMGGTPLADDIPIRKAWRIKRRIYVRVPYRSRLNDELRGLGAKWDGEVRALWTGTGKAEAVTELVRANLAAKAAIEERKAAGFPVKVPYEAGDIRWRAKDLGAIWGGKEDKRWYLPTAETAAEIERLVDERKAARAEAAAAAKPKGRRGNRYAGDCHHCGGYVPAGAGEAFYCDGDAFGCMTHFDGGWAVLCHPCNSPKTTETTESR